MLRWSETGRKAPATPEDLASEVIWIILCAGRKAQAARTIERKVWAAIHGGRPVVEAFGYRAKAAAMEFAWVERQANFEALGRILPSGDAAHIVDWCASLPFVGDDTKYQLAKNVGVAVCKPDIWLCRLAGIPDRPRLRLSERFACCMALCEALSKASGDNVATVDTLLWLAAQKGVLMVSPEAGPVTFVRRVSSLRPVLDFGDTPPAA